LFVSSGIELNLIFKKEFSQKEEITKPNDMGTFFENGIDTKKRIRNAYNGNLDAINSFVPMLNFALSYQLALNNEHTMKLVPKVEYAMGISKMSNDLDWKSNQLRLGISLVYSTKALESEQKEIWFIDTIRKSDTNLQQNIVKIGKTFIETSSEVNNDEYKRIITNANYRRDTLYFTNKEYKKEEVITKVVEVKEIPQKRKSNIDASVSITFNDKDNNSKNLEKLQLEEFTSTLMNPLLNYIFFDENQSEIPKRYIKLDKSAISSFEISKVNFSDKLATYYNILNIIGKRMQDNPKASISLIGCNQNNGLEKANLGLSKQRAEQVANYLKDIWQIDSKRIKISARNLPEKQLSVLNDESNVEHRRVEIYSSSSEILAPIITSDTYISANPTRINFDIKCKSDTTIVNWNLEISQGSKILKKFESNNLKDTLISWDFINDKDSYPRYADNLNYRLYVRDVESSEINLDNKLNIDNLTVLRKKSENISDRQIDRYSLILFDANSSEIKNQNKFIIDFIKSKTSDQSKFQITGSTDKIGNKQANYKLSEDRARNTAISLGVLDKATILGKADDLNQIDNNSPESRFYNRTVEIIVETPIKGN
jgi:outer membrane protein OmpA-like peptidoglycan-associated protein